MNIKLICVGKIKESYLKDACNEYLKRITKFCNIDIIELDDEKLPDTLSPTNINSIKDKEGAKILTQIAKISKPYIICLDLKGNEVTSTEFSHMIQNINLQGYSTIVYIIGGSLGISSNVIEKANNILSFSKLTFPHQLFRVFLLEQIYRGFKIINNERYHH